MVENIPHFWVRHYCACWIGWLAYLEAVFPPVKARANVLPFRRRA
jgi:hypothetical protein